MALRLGFHYHIPIYQDERGKLITPGYLGRFLDSLALHCETLTCFSHSPRPDEIPQMDYTIQASNVCNVNIGPHTSVPDRMLHSRQYSRLLCGERNQLDVLLLRGPSPLLPTMAQAAGNLPIALLLVGDYLAGIDDLPQPRWRKEAIRLWSYWNSAQQLRVTKHALTFVNSRKLYEGLKPRVPLLFETRTTTLSASDFYEREDTCLQPPYHLLYTGRMSRAKGLLQIVEAVYLLFQQGEDVILDLVGWPEKGDPILDEISDYATSHNIGTRVIYHGFKAVGQELFECYRRADIYVIASQSSEGFPRTIWEAMAQSLPVVATKVGAIGDFLKDEQTVLLAEDTTGVAIAKSVSNLIHNPVLRRRIIQQGIDLARQNTLENRASELITKIESWLSGNVKTTKTC